MLCYRNLIKLVLIQKSEPTHKLAKKEFELIHKMNIIGIVLLENFFNLSITRLCSLY